MAKVQPIRSKPAKLRARSKLVHQFLVVLSGTDPIVWRHPEHESMLQWAGGSYEPNVFDPKAIVFDDPRKRWKKAFER